MIGEATTQLLQHALCILVNLMAHTIITQTEEPEQILKHQTAIRIMDILLSSLALVVLLPIFAAISIAIKLDSPGSVLFKQRRVGYNGQHFICYKFRSMIADAEDSKKMLEMQNERGEIVFKMRDDPRVTRVGKFLRRTSIDELPQIFNILFGEMSIVGPRPGLPCEVEMYTERQLKRLAAPAGLTGLWQVSGRAAISFEKMIELDLLYIEQRSFWLNLRIIWLTIPAVLFGKGAY